MGDNCQGTYWPLFKALFKYMKSLAMEWRSPCGAGKRSSKRFDLFPKVDIHTGEGGLLLEGSFEEVLSD